MTIGKLIVGVGCGIVFGAVLLLVMCAGWDVIGPEFMAGLQPGIEAIKNPSYGTTAASEEAETPRPPDPEVEVEGEARSGLDIAMGSCAWEGDFLHARGTVANTGQLGMSAVKLSATFRDSAGRVVDTREVFPVGLRPLLPGDQVPFEILTRNTNAVTCEVHFAGARESGEVR